MSKEKTGFTYALKPIYQSLLLLKPNNLKDLNLKTETTNSNNIEADNAQYTWFLVFDHVAADAIWKFRDNIMRPADKSFLQVLHCVIIFAATYNLCFLVHHDLFTTADKMLNWRPLSSITVT